MLSANPPLADRHRPFRRPSAWPADRARRPLSPVPSGILVLALALALGAAASPAAATTKLWNNAGGGAAGTPGNWNPTGVPAAIDFLAFDLNNTYTVTYSSSVPVVHSHDYYQGNVTLSISGTHTVTDYFGVLKNSATLTTGHLLCEDRVDVGRHESLVGTLNVTTGDAFLEAGVINVADDPTGLQQPNRGAMNVTGGGYVATGALNLAFNAGGTADVGVAGYSFNPLGRSTILSNGEVVVGLQGDATLDVTSAGTVHAAGNDGSLVIAQGQSSTSTVTVENSFNGLHAFLEVDEDLAIGRTLAGARGGIGRLNVNADGNVQVGGTTRVGHTSGGSGTLHVGEGGYVTTHSLIFEDTNATFDFDGGRVQVDGGTFNPVGTDLTVNSTTGSPHLELVGGATMTLTQPVSPFKALEIGTSSVGQVSLLDGSSCTIGTGNIGIGRNTGSTGTFIVDTGATLTAPAGWNLTFGLSGTATGTIGGGSQVTAGTVNLGTQAAGNGTLTIQGAGTSLTALDHLYIGGFSGGAAGTGTVTIVNAGQLVVDQTGDAATVIWNDGGILNVNLNADFISPGSIDHRGEIHLQGGTIDVQRISFTGAAEITGWGTVQGQIFANDVLATLSASGGSLDLGDATDPAGFVNVGTLSVGNQTVTLRDSNEATLGNVQMNGGTLALPNGGVLVSGKTLSGNGTVAGAVSNSGAISTTGAGLKFDGILSGVGQGISGDLITFMDDGGFTGAGTLPVRVDGDPGSIVTATGNLTIGVAASATGVVMDGDLGVGSHTVTLLDSNGITLTGTTAIAGGNLTYAAGTLTVGAGGTLGGTGRATTPLLQNGGTLSPGAQVGGFTVIGAYTQQGGGTLAIELGDHASDEWDAVRITQLATLAGTLRVTARPNFVPSMGDDYRIMTFPSRSGHFSNVTFQGFPTGVVLDIVYGTDFVDLVVTDVGTAGVEEPEAPAQETITELRFFGRSASQGPELDLRLPWPADVRVSVYDVTGRMLGTLADGPLPTGAHRFSMRGIDASSAGIYFGRMELERPEMPDGAIVRTARILVLR